MDLKDLSAGFRYLSAYKHLLDEPVLKSFWHMAVFASLDQAETPGACCDFFAALKAEGYLSLGDWLWDTLRYTESPYGLLVEKGGQDPELEQAARQDIDVLLAAARLSRAQVLAAAPKSLDPQRLPWWKAGPPPFDFDTLTAFYRQNGCGRFARYQAFRWGKEGLVPISHPDAPQPWELLGYTRQRDQVADNARALLAGRQVNHVLLYGESGTGKSATVKSLLALPGFEALRMVELDKDALGDIPALLRLLAGRPQKFILFLDDLTFDRDDNTYAQLKSILEGGLEKRPDNVVVYATSNRRNLIRQTFSDRLGDEVDAAETVSEKTSLADRFGVRINYQALRPQEYLDLVREMAKLYHLDWPADKLDAAASRWVIRNPGRTPRTARQFIADALGTAPEGENTNG